MSILFFNLDLLQFSLYEIYKISHLILKPWLSIGSPSLSKSFDSRTEGIYLLTPIALAHWYMDDSHYYHGGIFLNT